MLGLGRKTKSWHWAACGKHPAARDYFGLDAAPPMIGAFEKWVESGYRTLPAQKDRPEQSWRFWCRGPERGILVCGGLRDSCDAIGRPFPLLVMGQGPLKGWEEAWELLPLAVEPLWLKIADIFSKERKSLADLQYALGGLNHRAPIAFDVLSAKRPPGGEDKEGSAGRIGMENDRLRKYAQILLTDGMLVIPLLPDGRKDPLGTVIELTKGLKRQLPGIPNAVFIGGTLSWSHLALFGRPFGERDFIRLWTVSGRSEAEPGS
jgi:type VI secretion system ImpM family protein